MLGIINKKYTILEKLKETIPYKKGQKKYIVLGGAILTIIILHFVLQFSFIQSENVQTIQNLTKVEEYKEDDEFTERITEKVVVSTKENEADVKDVADVKNKPVSEATTPPKTEYNTKKVKIISKPKVTSPPVQSRPKNVQSRIVIKKKVPPQETRAERLRRAERILTGV